MRAFFSQFGVITRLRLSRSKKVIHKRIFCVSVYIFLITSEVILVLTASAFNWYFFCLLQTGGSRGYAFIEFKYEDVAKLVAETMNNYLMFTRLLKCKYFLSNNFLLFKCLASVKCEWVFRSPVRSIKLHKIKLFFNQLFIEKMWCYCHDLDVKKLFYVLLYACSTVASVWWQKYVRFHIAWFLGLFFLNFLCTFSLSSYVFPTLLFNLFFPLIFLPINIILFC